MNKYLSIIYLCICSSYGYTQVYSESELVGTKYLEDQFYIGLGYNFIFNRPEDVVQRNLSYNLQTGFIKDVPLNSGRNVALGIGLGYAVNSYYTNLLASQTMDGVSYQISDGTDFRRSKFETHAIEVPFELRWRNSTATDYKFWRIYAGLRFAYLFSARSKFIPENGDSDNFDNEDIERFQYGPTLNFGYNTFNLHIYYGLNSLLKNSTALNEGSNLDLNVFRVGVIFYIL